MVVKSGEPEVPDAAAAHSPSQTPPAAKTTGNWERHGGPPILRHGFRPFFLVSALWAGTAVALWLPMLLGWIGLPSAFDSHAWHAHEMIFGFVAAAVAGFILTAIPNWTGRLPLRGLPLLCLLSVWFAGRLAVAFSLTIGPTIAAAIDLAFLILLVGFALREIVAGRNWQNLPIGFVLFGFIAANALMHAEVLDWIGADGIGARLGIAIIALIISLIGGRIIPSFTRNWLVKRGDTVLPAPFGRFDRLCIVLVLIAMAVWAVRPESAFAAGILVLAGLASLVRWQRWQWHRTLAEPLLWSLHLGFLWIPVGLLLLGTHGFLPLLPTSAGLHALTTGGAGSMILAVMTRATLGHTGHELHADRATAAIYLLIFAAAVLRLAAVFLPFVHWPLLMASAAAWITAFLLFVVRYAPMMFVVRNQRSPNGAMT
ncbi:MAG: NnrS family protein [Rhodospirillaceae bacterium]|nr:NnrS family protein [Rhodospirillaceae bacterium]